MNALQEVTQIERHNWCPANDTGARAYDRRQGQKLVVPERIQHHSPFDDLESQLPEVSEKRQSALSEIRKSFVFRDEEAVTSFLRDHRTIAQLLLEALPALKKFFGVETVFELKVLTEEDGSREMYAMAEWPGPAREAMRALDNFIENWWIERSGTVGGRLNFTYELE